MCLCIMCVYVWVCACQNASVEVRGQHEEVDWLSPSTLIAASFVWHFVGHSRLWLAQHESFQLPLLSPSSRSQEECWAYRYIHVSSFLHGFCRAHAANTPWATSPSPQSHHSQQAGVTLICICFRKCLFKRPCVVLRRCHKIYKVSFCFRFYFVSVESLRFSCCWCCWWSFTLVLFGFG